MKPIEGFTGYFITSRGEVISKRKVTDRLLRSHRDKDGYLNSRIYREKVPFNLKVHRIVALAFIPNPENKPQVNHINGDKADNRVENLEWCTQSENMQHSYGVLGRSGPMTGKALGNHPSSRKIIQLDSSFNKIKSFSSITEAAKEVGVGPSAICSVVKGRKKSAGGFRWRYA